MPKYTQFFLGWGFPNKKQNKTKQNQGHGNSVEGIVLNRLVPHLQGSPVPSRLQLTLLSPPDYIFLCICILCTVWRVHCAQPGLYEAQQRSNKSSPLLLFFLHVTSLQAQSSCSSFLRKAKARYGWWLTRRWLRPSWDAAALSWRLELCMSHGCLSARYTCTAQPSSSQPPKPSPSPSFPSTSPPAPLLCQQQVYSCREASSNSFRESFWSRADKQGVNSVAACDTMIRSWRRDNCPLIPPSDVDRQAESDGHTVW